MKITFTSNYWITELKSEKIRTKKGKWWCFSSST